MTCFPGLTRKLALAALLGAGACGYPNTDPLQFTPVGTELVLNGVIDAAALDAFDRAMAAHPHVTGLVLAEVPGSLDDEANLELARRVRGAGLRTRIPPGGTVASGGTDLFLAGVTRSIGQGACVGVHSWGDGYGSGADAAPDAPVHQEYLSYYREMGVPEGFYWYTLQVADVDDMHWMRAAELNRFNMTNGAAPPVTGTGPVCEARLNAAGG